MSRLAEMQARFQQKQMQEKEEKLLRLFENQQQRAIDRVGKGSAGSNASLGSTGGGKVRQMSDERRPKAGIDRSYPLEPLKNSRTGGISMERNKKETTRTSVKTTQARSFNVIKNGKPIVNKQEIVENTYNNNNGDEYFEQRRYKNGDNDQYDSSNFDLISMMNRNNIQDNLDHEVLPQIGFDEVDKEAKLNGKLSNGKLGNGGKLPSETVAKKKYDTRPFVKSNFASPSVKTVAKKPVKAPAPATKSISSSSSKSATPPSPNKSTVKPMSKPTVKEPTTASRSPNTERPSSKQGPKQSPQIRDDLSECQYCGRKFASDRLGVHEGICGKSGKKKRKAYDSTRHRVAGTELEPFVQKPTKMQKPTVKEPTTASRSPNTERPSSKQGPKQSPQIRDDLSECQYCGRKFASDRLGVHEGICGKSGKKKRKAYDSTRHRVAGTELEPFVQKPTKMQKAPKPASKKDWRKTHEEFIAAIRSAKEAQIHLAKGGKLSDLPPPPPSSNPDYVQCPHCGRRFNEQAASRHIPQCANFQYNKPKPGQSKGKAKK